MFSRQLFSASDTWNANDSRTAIPFTGWIFSDLTRPISPQMGGKE